MDESTFTRFMLKVEVQLDGCWHRRGPVNSGGYSRFSAGGARTLAHRASCEHFNGPIPPGYRVDHLCHTRDLSCPGGRTCPHRRCVNPMHLEAVTHRENVLRGRGTGAISMVRPTCVHGHLRTLENTYVPPSGVGRQCKVCRSVANRRFWASKPKREPKTHCPAGHLYAGSNLYIANGRRRCRECHRVKARAAWRNSRMERIATHGPGHPDPSRDSSGLQ